MDNVLYEGAEAKILKIDEDKLKKVRLEKKYRIEEIDSRLRRQRTRREFKVLTRLYENKVNVPEPLKFEDRLCKQFNEQTDVSDLEEFSIEMEYLKGEVLKNTIDENKLKLAFNEIIKMHELGITHGDLTTLNMIDHNNKVYIIDFGLAQFSERSEDKAVDLHLFWNCIKNEHNELYKFKEELLKKYSKDVLNKLDKLEKRGRNK